MDARLPETEGVLVDATDFSTSELLQAILAGSHV